MRVTSITAAVAALVLALFSFGASVRADDVTWTSLYKTDFSTDPGWTTNSSSDMFWDSSNKRYQVKLTNGVGQYTYVDPFGTNTYDPASTYLLKFDLTVTNLDWAATVSFGFGDSDMKPYESVSLIANYGRGDGGNGGTIQYFDDSSGDYFPGAYEFAFGTNVTYRNEILHDGKNNAIHWKVVRLSDNVTLVDKTESSVGTFTGFDRLTASRAGVVYAGARVGEGYLDNVELLEGQVVPTPSAAVAGFGFLGLLMAGRWLRRRRMART